MASQPVSAAQYVNVGTLGTTVITDRSANLYSVVLPGTYVGSIEFYDSATAAGTAATNLIYNLGLPLLNQYKDIQLNLRTRFGLTIVATGTPTVLFTWE